MRPWHGGTAVDHLKACSEYRMIQGVSSCVTTSMLRLAVPTSSRIGGGHAFTFWGVDAHVAFLVQCKSGTCTACTVYRSSVVLTALVPCSADCRAYRKYRMEVPWSYFSNVNRTREQVCKYLCKYCGMYSQSVTQRRRRKRVKRRTMVVLIKYCSYQKIARELTHARVCLLASIKGAVIPYWPACLFVRRSTHAQHAHSQPALW